MNDQDYTLQDVLSAIEVYNVMIAGKTGSGTFDVGSLSRGLSSFSLDKQDWKVIESGPLQGSRACENKFGYLLQRPQPINEISLIAKDTAKVIGIV